MRFALALVLVLGCGGPATPAARPGNPAVYERIAALSDCRALQQEFETADANGKRHRAAGETDQAKWTTAYMAAADERMKALRCY